MVYKTLEGSIIFGFNMNWDQIESNQIKIYLTYCHIFRWSTEQRPVCDHILAQWLAYLPSNQEAQGSNPNTGLPFFQI